MKTLIKDYVFNKAANQIIFTGQVRPVNIEQLLLVTNVKTGDIIYNFADKLRGGTLVNNVLTLDRNTTEMNDTDSLQIFIETEIMIDALNEINRTLNSLKKIQGFPDTSGRQRVNIETGVVTVTRVDNVDTFGGLYTRTLIGNTMNIGPQNLRSRIGVS